LALTTSPGSVASAPGIDEAIDLVLTTGAATEEDAGITDPDFSSVSLLLPFDGANGSTTFTDLSNNSFTITRFGDTQISTAQSKFGGASGLFDGSGDYLETASNSAFDFGTGNLTIEMFVRLVSASGFPNVWSQRNNIFSSAGGITFRVTTDRQLQFFYGAGVAQTTGSSVLALNEWHHIALTREGANFKLWANGILDGTSSSITASMDSGIAPRIGGAAWGSEWLNGYIDDLRITKGVARYTANFTPPTAAFPTS
jgi:hypothetical protein